jgi:ABC-type polysaccharide/polyol phosphate export permease
MTDSSRAQGGLICAGVVVVGLIFLLGVLSGSYWALAIPVAALVFFVLGLTFWVGWTIATIRVEPEQAESTPASPAPAALTPNQKQA